MEAQTKKFRTFEDLDAYNAAREFRTAMYAVARRLPEIEKFGLASQIRRAAVSLTNNIAEGHGRYHYPDQIRFMLQSRGSLEELIDDLKIYADERYLSSSETATLKDQGWLVHKVLNGDIRHLRSRNANQPYVLRDEVAAGEPGDIASNVHCGDFNA